MESFTFKYDEDAEQYCFKLKYHSIKSNIRIGSLHGVDRDELETFVKNLETDQRGVASWYDKYNDTSFGTEGGITTISITRGSEDAGVGSDHMEIVIPNQLCRLAFQKLLEHINPR